MSNHHVVKSQAELAELFRADITTGVGKSVKHDSADKHVSGEAVYVDDRDIVWISEWNGNAVFSFDPRSERFERHVLPRDNAKIRQILGRPGEVWLPESGTEHITVIRG